MLTPEELRRYQRQMILPEMGSTGQEKLRAARVLVVGAGGLGCPVLLYLTAAGIGTIGVVDGDVVSESNLHRQVLYGPNDIGKPKVETAARRLQAMNPFIRIAAYSHPLHRSNALDIMVHYDWVVDCTDNFPARYLINDACVLLNKPFVYAAIHRFEGQVSVFNYTDQHGQTGPTYRCLFPVPPPPDQIPNCAEAGVLGILPGIVGLYQATEVVKAVTGMGKVLSGELLLMDLLQTTFRKIRIRRTPIADQITQLADYEAFCSDPTSIQMPTLEVQELQEKLVAGEPIWLLDVREPHEYEICRLAGAHLIPLPKLSTSVPLIPRSGIVVVYCHRGGRSINAIKKLQQNFGFTNLYNLAGGIDAWAREIDETMETY